MSGGPAGGALDLTPIPFEELLAEGGETACCAAVYGHPAVRFMLDGGLHPGGEAMTLRTAKLAGIGRGDRVVDVASGSGATAILLARELGCEVVGVEAGAESVALATDAAAEAGVGERVEFVAGDAERLPFGDGEFDAAICECSLCLFGSKERAAAEIARVVRPGGAVGVSDVTADPDSLPAELRTVAAKVACIAGALPLAGYEELLRRAGLEPMASEERREEITAMADRVEARLRVARIARIPEMEPFRDDLAAAIELAKLTVGEIAAGRIGYAVIGARRAA